MRKLTRSGQFKRDVKRMAKGGHDMEPLRNLITILTSGKPIPSEYRDHPLIGNWKGYRDAHIKSDWILIYKVDDENLWLARTGSHADIFG